VGDQGRKLTIGGQDLWIHTRDLKNKDLFDQA
jgi:hypothetical protein